MSEHDRAGYPDHDRLHGLRVAGVAPEPLRTVSKPIPGAVMSAAAKSVALRFAAVAAVVVTALTACTAEHRAPPANARGSSGSTAVLPTSVPTAIASAMIPAPTQPTHWLCRPNMPGDPCERDLDATVVSADGARSVVPFRPAAHPSIDCFYVYPTVSSAPGGTAPLASSPEIVAAVRAQAARFAQVCRLFVPLYRQNTLAAVTSGQVGKSDVAYGDIASAWHDYLLHDNDGRGVALIGHSQGAIVLRRLIQTEIDGQAAVRARLVSAILPGANVSVPANADVGADFRHIPACRRVDQTGCVLAWSTFDAPPPSPSLFGRVGGGRRVLCTNPAALGGGAALLHPYLPTGPDAGALPRTSELGSLTTGFVALPGAVTGTCAHVNGADVLLVHGAIGGRDMSTFDRLGPTWGLHALDVTIVLGDLVDLIGRQAAAFARR